MLQHILRRTLLSQTNAYGFFYLDEIMLCVPQQGRTQNCTYILLVLVLGQNQQETHEEFIPE